MSWKAKHKKAYGARLVADALSRLAKRVDLSTLPFSDEELTTLAQRARQSFSIGSTEKLKGTAAYRDGLARVYGAASVNRVWEALRQINNEIGYEEK